MQVKSLVDHSNDFGVRDGEPYEKKKGTVYNIDDDAHAKLLLDAGIVSRADHDKGSSKE